MQRSAVLSGNIAFTYLDTLLVQTLNTIRYAEQELTEHQLS